MTQRAARTIGGVAEAVLVVGMTARAGDIKSLTKTIFAVPSTTGNEHELAAKIRGLLPKTAMFEDDALGTVAVRLGGSSGPTLVLAALGSTRARTTECRRGRRGSGRTRRGRHRSFRFFDDILATPATAFLAICHSFGVLVRWAGVAEAVLRSELKGGKSQGVVSNVLTAEARDHPYFSAFWNESSGAEIKVLDSRLYDLLPTGRPGIPFLAFEDPCPTGLTDALTMCEFARRADGVLPRIWGVNCHPEIGDRGLQRERLDRMAERGEVTAEWIRERHAALIAWQDSASHEHSLQRTSGSSRCAACRAFPG